MVLHSILVHQCLNKVSLDGGEPISWPLDIVFIRALISPVSEEEHLKLLQLSYANNVHITSKPSGCVQCYTWFPCLAVAKQVEFLNTVACYKLAIRSWAVE